MEICDSSLVKLISEKEKTKILKLLNDDIKLKNDFEKYDKPIDLILNLGFSINKEINFEQIIDKLFTKRIESGLTSDTIIELIESSPLKESFGKYPQDKTLQFVCLDHELNDMEFIYREYKILNF